VGLGSLATGRRESTVRKSLAVLATVFLIGASAMVFGPSPKTVPIVPLPAHAYETCEEESEGHTEKPDNSDRSSVKAGEPFVFIARFVRNDENNEDKEGDDEDKCEEENDPEGERVSFSQKEGPSRQSSMSPLGRESSVSPFGSVFLTAEAAPAGCQATFNPASALTDAQGRARTTVTLPAGCPCQFTLAATAGGQTVTTTVREDGCLPFTGADTATSRIPLGLGNLLTLAGLTAALMTVTVMVLVRRRLRSIRKS
jgi:hypothetical protein